MTNELNREAVALADIEWLERQKDHGHCGEGLLEAKMRGEHNDRINRLLLSLRPATDEVSRDVIAILGGGSDSFEAEARHLHAIMREVDWYGLAGSEAERRLHERLTRLVSCEEFGSLLSLLPVPGDGKEKQSP